MTPSPSTKLKVKTPDLLNLNEYKNVHPFVKMLFQENKESFPPAGKLKYFLKNWEKVTNDTTILNIVKSYSIEFVESP